MTRTDSLPSMMSEQLGTKYVPMEARKMATSMTLTDCSPNLVPSDELNTPEIGLNTTEFKFGNTVAAPSPVPQEFQMPADVDMSVWGEAPPIPFNASQEAQQLTDIFGWSRSHSMTVLQRPAELKLAVQATPIYNNDTPNGVMDTPDILKQFDTNAQFDIVNFVLGDNSETPQISSTSAMEVSDSIIVKQEDPSTDESRSPHCVTSTSGDADDVYQPNMEYINLPSTSSCLPASNKRRKSSENIKYHFSDSDDDSDFIPTKIRKTQITVKQEYDDDESSIAGSAAEGKFSDLRQRNNEASRRSRMNRKLRENEMERKADELEAVNRDLRARLNRMENVRNQLRKHLLEIVKKNRDNK